MVNMPAEVRWTSSGALTTDGSASEWGSLILFALLAAALMVYPILRVFSAVEVSYNEGWNVYNAAAADQGLPLYKQKIGWTTVNYPVLSFYAVAWLHQTGLSYLTAGRILSLVSLPLSCLLVGIVVWRLSHDWRSALFSGLFCSAVFCIVANEYCGFPEASSLLPTGNSLRTEPPFEPAHIQMFPFESI